MSRQGAREGERGFTLVEVLLVVILMGIVLAIASSSFFGAVESRRVDSGTNRLAADLRHAHSRAINRLADQTVTLTAGSSKYTMTGVTDPIDLDDFPQVGNDVIVADAATTVVFKGDGSATVTGANPITVGSAAHPNNNHTIQITPATSEIQSCPIDC